jgi:hypothetical protein
VIEHETLRDVATPRPQVEGTINTIPEVTVTYKRMYENRSSEAGQDSWCDVCLEAGLNSARSSIT